jgi:hypothetical protein
LGLVGVKLSLEEISSLRRTALTVWHILIVAGLSVQSAPVWSWGIA